MSNFQKAIADFLLDTPDPVLQVSSNSMYPFLSARQKIGVKPVQKPLRRGKCYIFIYNKRLTVHRLLMTQKKEAVFIGDSSQSLQRVPVDAIIAEPDYIQNDFITGIIGWLNLLFTKIAQLLPVCTILRIKIIRGICGVERFLYERKI